MRRNKLNLQSKSIVILKLGTIKIKKKKKKSSKMSRPWECYKGKENLVPFSAHKRKGEIIVQFKFTFI